jgi:hypothetical protein
MPTFPKLNLPGLRGSGPARNHNMALKFFLIAASSAFVLFSCENYRPGEPVMKQYVKVTNVNRDTVVVIPNEKSASTIGVSFVETLSDTALVRISPDTAFSKNGSFFLLPVTNPPLMYISGLTGDSLYIKYQPYKKPISGDLTIEITFQN